MKRFSTILLTLAMCFTLFACGGKPTETNSEIAEPSNQPSPVTQTQDTEPNNHSYTSNVRGVINVSINPEVEFEIDENNHIARVIYCNEDATTAYSELKLEGMDVNEAMLLIVKTAREKGYLKDGNDISLNYGSTGYASAEESLALIASAKDALCEGLLETGSNSAVVLNVNNYTNDDSICDLCFGIGQIVCDNCGGKAYGNGMVLCDLCFGSGIESDDDQSSTPPPKVKENACRHCNGTGIKTIQAQTCYTCNGTGLCINCGGSGQELTDRGDMGSCHACGGSGDCLQQVCEGGVMPARSETCDKCGGTGVGNGDSNDEPGPASDNGCHRCNGSGYMTCNTCNGNLMDTCYRCDGTGIRIQHEPQE